ncbi:MAG: bacteriohopanetetrol glucosamine biosynthesis glycosyltransferase HpnI [Candidatus Sulfotelmatobacter sp.]
MIHSIGTILQIIAILGCASSSAFYLLCLWSAWRFLGRRRSQKDARAAKPLPGVSILKPLKGTDPDIYQSFRSHCLQDYPEFEIIFGVSDPDDPAITSVQQLQREFPNRALRLVICPEKLGPNVKVSNLEQMVRGARYQYLIVNDSDILVERNYLQKVVAPLVDPNIGMVTCLYRGIAEPTLGSQLESLGISTDFCAGVLAAQQLEGSLHFGLGSTLAFRGIDLDKIGGFRAIVDYLADDYELGRRLSDLGLKVLLSDVVVETHLPAYDLRGFLSHQLRWARGIRDARLGGYIGLASTFGIFWSLLNLILARAAPWSWAVLAGVVLLRIAVAFAVGNSILHDRQVSSRLWLLPLRDLIAVGVWLASFFGQTVIWRGEKFQLKNGRLTRITP